MCHEVFTWFSVFQLLRVQAVTEWLAPPNVFGSDDRVMAALDQGSKFCPSAADLRAVKANLRLCNPSFAVLSPATFRVNFVPGTRSLHCLAPRNTRRVRSGMWCPQRDVVSAPGCGVRSGTRCPQRDASPWVAPAQYGRGSALVTQALRTHSGAGANRTLADSAE